MPWQAQKAIAARPPDSAAKAIAAYDQVIELAQKMGDAPLQQQALIGKTRIYLYKLGDLGAGLKIAEEGKALIGNHPAGEAPEILQWMPPVGRCFRRPITSWHNIPGNDRCHEPLPGAFSRLAICTGKEIWKGNRQCLCGNRELHVTFRRPRRRCGPRDNLAMRMASAFLWPRSPASITCAARVRSALDADEGALNQIEQTFRMRRTKRAKSDRFGEIYNELDDSEREHDAVIPCIAAVTAFWRCRQ